LHEAISTWQVQTFSQRLLQQWIQSSIPLQVEDILTSLGISETLLNSAPVLSLETALGRSPLTLGHLCTFWQWLWVRSNQDLMPFLGGVPTYRLRPQQPWAVGTLTVSGYLVLAGSGTSPQYLDLATRHWQQDPPTLFPDDVLHLQTAPSLAKDVWSVAALQEEIQARVQERSPLLAHLMIGSELTVKTTNPVQLRLVVNLSFYYSGVQVG
jgi:hypothetical protein